MNYEQHLRTFNYFKTVSLDHAFDNLTGVLCREHIMPYCEYLAKNNIPFTYAIVDLDNFKYINDNFGHNVGDTILVDFVKLLILTVGSKGVVARFGGDEFIVVLEQMQEYEDVWNLFHLLNGNLMDFNTDIINNVPLTATTGISRFPMDSKCYDEIFLTADKALYRGKQKGRNCFIVYLEEKHKNLLNCETKMDHCPEFLQFKIFSTLTKDCNFKENFKELFEFLTTYYMFDNICFETENEMLGSKIHSLSKFKNFKHIDYSILKNSINEIGIFNCKNALILNDENPIKQELLNQNICSCLLFKVEVFNRFYGFLRIDMTNTYRIWQSNEINILYSFVNTLALLLYKHNLTLNDLF